MHPAKSVIYFTTASGAGYGLIVWLAVAAMFGLVPPDQAFGFVAFAVAVALIVTGLLSSTLHLGHPERAWRALSQWRSSWLSREGVAAIVAFAPIGVFGVLWVFFGVNSGVAAAVGALAALAAMATVYCTAMIYASLKTIPNWSDRWTPAGYLVLSLMTGAVLAALLSAAWGFDGAKAIAWSAAAALAAGLAIKLIYWRSVRTRTPVSTSGTATGLGRFGRVNLVDGPHTEANYLLEEMGFRVARRHAEKLRRISIVAGFAIPLTLVVLAAAFADGATLVFVLALAALACGIGVVAERWLFFAEAKHVVTLYYGERQI